MIKVLFICHGNICRSPMAEFLFKEYVKNKHTDNDFLIESAATSTEEIDNGVHPGTRKILSKLGINCSNKQARQITNRDVNYFDYIICMDQWNLRNLERMFGPNPKFSLLKCYIPNSTDNEISDPWYTGNFEETYKDISESLPYLYNYLINKN